LTNCRSTAAPILAVLAIVLTLMLFGAYVGGYFWLGQSCVVQNIRYIGDAEYLEPECPGRKFHSPWVATLYKPMGRAESWYRGVDLQVISDD
jgi:hypothetical protein